MAATLLTAESQKPSLPKDILPKRIDLQTIPLGLPAKRPIPAGSTLTKARVQLGRRLFFDPILSRHRQLSCASCHRPDRAFAGSNTVAVGSGGKRGTRNAPSLFNVAFSKSLFWDGRSKTLEEQASLPITNPRELGSDAKEVLRRLRAEPTYVAQFHRAFGNKKLTMDQVALAIAAFERTLLSGNSRVDRFHAGEAGALSTEERQGLWIFESRGRCWKCHSGRILSDGKFHNTGVSWGKKPMDLGRFQITKKERDRGAFKTPPLRNVARTAPYMHDGSLATLEEVVRFYNKGGQRNPYLDPAMRPLQLSKRDEQFLVAFLRALTGQSSVQQKRRP